MPTSTRKRVKERLHQARSYQKSPPSEVRILVYAAESDLDQRDNPDTGKRKRLYLAQTAPPAKPINATAHSIEQLADMLFVFLQLLSRRYPPGYKKLRSGDSVYILNQPPGDFRLLCRLVQEDPDGTAPFRVGVSKNFPLHEEEMGTLYRELSKLDKREVSHSH